MISKDVVKSRIKEEYGTIKRFAKLHNIAYRTVINALHGYSPKDGVERILKDAKVIREDEQIALRN